MSAATVGRARRGEKMSIASAEKIAAVLDVPVKKIFTLNEETSGLSDKTILHHHRLLTAILGKAKKEQIIMFNVAAEHADAPKVKRKEARYLDDVQARELVQLLLREDDVRVKTCLLLALYSGVRRGELCGLSWHDIDEKNGVIHILRASQYQVGKGVVEVPTKNESSKRVIKLPPFIFDILAQYRKWWAQQKLFNGSRWQGQENRLFIQSDGKPLQPDTINFWLDKFIEKHGLQRFTPHALRHTFSTLQIMQGVNLRTVAARTGHAQVSTLTDIYSHAIKTADEMAADALDDILTPKAYRKVTGYDL
jgi:integrase